MKHESRGFTLIEMVVVLTIIGLLIGGLLIPLTTQIDVAKIQRTENILEQTKQALIHYAMRNNRLPCPETGCDKLGSLPWERLGVGRYDAWGNPIQYHTCLDEEDKIVEGTDWIKIDDPDDPKQGFKIIDVRGNQLVDQTDVVAIIFSYGKNGIENQNSKSDLLPISAKMDLDRYYPIETVINFIFTRALAASFWTPEPYYIKGEPLSKQSSDDILRWLSRNYLIAVGKQSLPVRPQEPEGAMDYADLSGSSTGSGGGTTDPTTTDPGTTDPTTTDPGTTDPTTTDPGTTDPTTTDPGTTDPTTTDPGTTDPTTTDPGTTDPTTTDPGTTDPTTTDPGTTDPTTTDPTGTDPETKVDIDPWGTGGGGFFKEGDISSPLSGSSGGDGFDPSSSGFGEKGAIESGSFPSQ